MADTVFGESAIRCVMPFTSLRAESHDDICSVVPGITKPGGRCNRPVSLIDICPALIELCGLTPKPELEGNSQVSLLTNPRASWDRPALTTYKRNHHSVRSERWRFDIISHRLAACVTGGSFHMLREAECNPRNRVSVY